MPRISDGTNLKGEHRAMNTTELEEQTAPFIAIAGQSRALYEAMKEPHFDGFTRLDPTLNKAWGHIHAADEIIVRYPQGKFPRVLAREAVKETLRLLYQCRKRYGRRKTKLMEQAFHAHFILWYAVRKWVPAELFAKKIFESEDKLIRAICDHNAGIVEPRKTKPRTKRRGASQKYIAYLFMRDIRTVRRWDRDISQAPRGYSKALRLSGNQEELMSVVRAFHWESRVKGGDIYTQKLVVHFKSDETLYRMLFDR